MCIVTKRSFLSCSTTQRQNHGAFNFTSLNDAILQLPRLSVYALCMWIYSANCTCCCQSPFPSLQLLAALTASLVSYGVVTLRIFHNEFHCRTSFSHPFCCLLLPLFYELDLSFSHLLVSLFCAYKLLYPCTT